MDLFRLDTPFDTYPAITDALSKALNELGQAVALNAIGGLARPSLDRCVEASPQRCGLDAALLRSRFRAICLTVPPANQPPFPGVSEVYSFIHAHDGLNVVVTHRSLQSTQRLLDFHGLAPLFVDSLSVE